MTRSLAWILGCVALAAVGCEISPVVTAPEGIGTRYGDCDRAAREYCEHGLEVDDAQMDRCVAEHRFRCVSSGALPSPLRRS